MDGSRSCLDGYRHSLTLTQALVAELNNGRLAMFGIMGFIAASKVRLS